MTVSPLLGLERITLRTAQRMLVNELSMSIAAGERWVVLGPNGAGKSTLLAAVAGARPVAGGTIRLAGHDVRTLAADVLARERALLTDRWIDPFASSALDTVLTARYVLRDESDAESAALDCLSRLDCAALADRDVRHLSRGERQRVAIATALAQDTRLLLLDEPTAHQDPRHQALVISELSALQGRAQLASLHDINAAARYATHALLLWGDGRTAAGAADDVLTPAVLSDLFDTPITRVAAAGEVFFHVHRRAA
jgi:iron complex transport system ATP-binding protein